MKGETLLGEKMRIAGLHARDAKLSTAIAEFLNNGGTIRRVYELVDAIAERMMNGGRGKDADMAAHQLPSIHQQNAANGPNAGAGKAELHLPDAATERNGAVLPQCADKARNVLTASVSPQPEWAGHQAHADKASQKLPASLASQAASILRSHQIAQKKMPGHAKRGLAAIAAIQDVVAKSLFDTTKLPDGRSLREVRWSEVPNLASRYSFLSSVMMAIHNRAIPPDPDATLDTIVSEDQLGEIIGTMERLNDIH